MSEPRSVRSVSEPAAAAATREVSTLGSSDPTPNRKGYLQVPRAVVFSVLSANARVLYMALLQWREHHEFIAKQFKKPKFAERRPSIPVLCAWSGLRHTALIMARRELIDARLLEIASGRAKRLRSGYVLLDPAEFIGRPATDNEKFIGRPASTVHRSARIHVVEAEPTRHEPRKAVEPTRSTPKRLASPGGSSSTAEATARATLRAELLAEYGKTEADVSPGSTFDGLLTARVNGMLAQRGIVDLDDVARHVDLMWDQILKAPPSVVETFNAKEQKFVEGHKANREKKLRPRTPGEEKYILDIFTQRVRPRLEEKR